MMIAINMFNSGNPPGQSMCLTSCNTLFAVQRTFNDLTKLYIHALNIIPGPHLFKTVFNHSVHYGHHSG